jgi:hypothetical protein
LWFSRAFFSASQKEAQRWRLAYGSRLVQEGIRDLELIREIDKKELLYDRLLLTVSSVLSINSLREDLQVNHFSAKASLILILLEPCLILTVQK